MCFEKDNVKNEEIVNHILRLGIGIGAGRKKKNTKKHLNCIFEIVVCD